MKDMTLSDVYRAISVKAQYCCYWRRNTILYRPKSNPGSSLELSIRYIYTAAAHIQRWQCTSLFTKCDNERDQAEPDLLLYLLHPIPDQIGSMSSFSILLDRNLQQSRVVKGDNSPLICIDHHPVPSVYGLLQSTSAFTAILLYIL
jgi:hypothetical protein